MTDRVEPLLEEQAIQRRVAELGAAITRDYRGHPLLLLCVLKGSFVFAADLARAIELPLTVEFMAVSSYGADTESSGVVQITLDLSRPINDVDVLIVEDIVDTGLTLDYLEKQLTARQPRSLKLCALLHKPARMIKPTAIDYLGFTIEDRFVVGYGLDFDQRYRNLPYIGVLQPEEPTA